MGSLTLVIGPPGTGKTEFDLRAIELWLKGVSREQVAYFAFMRAAAADGARRMGIGPEEARGLWFRTLHSTCFRILQLRRDAVVTPEWLKEFGERIGMPLENEEEGQGDAEEVAELILLMKTAPFAQVSAGSLYRRLYNLSRLLCRTTAELDASRLTPHVRASGCLWPDFRTAAYASFVASYEDAKAAGGKLDFVDMLERVLREDHALPRWRYSVIDEAQDLSALQLAVVDKICLSQCDMTILSGDDHQAIMTFQGASAEEFLNYRSRGQIIQLTQTHRFGDGIVEFSSRIAERIRNRQPRDVIGLKGRVSRVLNVYDFSPGDVLEGDLVMHRHVSGCHRVASRLVAGGIPFWNERGPNPLSRMSDIRAYLAWRALGKKAPIDADALQYLVNKVPSRKDGVQIIPRGMKKIIKGMAPAMPIPDPEKYLSRTFLDSAAEGNAAFLDCPFSEYYGRLEKNGHDLLDRPRTTVTTIHGAKGRQAPRTWLFSETYPKALAGNTDDEHRVAYVGATRAQHDVLLVRENLVGDWTGNYPYPEVACPAIADEV